MRDEKVYGTVMLVKLLYGVNGLLLVEIVASHP